MLFERHCFSLSPPHATSKTQNPMARKQCRRALKSHARWRTHPISPAPHAQQQAAPLLPKKERLFETEKGGLFETEREGKFETRRGTVRVQRREKPKETRRRSNTEAVEKRKSDHSRLPRHQRHQEHKNSSTAHDIVILFQLTIFFPRCSTIEEKAATCASARGRRRRKQPLSSATATFLTTQHHLHRPQHHLQLPLPSQQPTAP